jgi:uncharacterized protein
MEVIFGHSAQHQVVFLGPFGVGKTTALASVSDIEVASTDVVSAEVDLLDKQEGKTTTTTGIDYGEVRLSPTEKISLIGVPGQERFSAMTDILLPHNSAYVLWVYGDRDENLVECRRWLELLKNCNANAKMSMVVTRVKNEERRQKIVPYRELLSRYHPLAPVITGDPRRKVDVMQSIVMALSSPYMKIGA